MFVRIHRPGDLQLAQSGVVSTAAPANATNAMVLSNHLQAASSAFTTLAERFPQSSYVGKARLGLGWCYWLEGRWAESAAAFRQATERLASPEDLALAKSPDSQGLGGVSYTQVHDRDRRTEASATSA